MCPPPEADCQSPGSFPRQVSRRFCDGNQGDIVIYRDIVVRSWNTPVGTSGAFDAGLTCDGQPVAPGFEGLQVFDISNRGIRSWLGEIPLACGSHTASAVPDRRIDRLLVYSSPSAHSATNPNPPATCDWFNIVEVPLDDPEDAQVRRAEPADHTCHDIGVILGESRGRRAGGLPDVSLAVRVVARWRILCCCTTSWLPRST
jgi:hypothetical protein